MPRLNARRAVRRPDCAPQPVYGLGAALHLRAGRNSSILVAARRLCVGLEGQSAGLHAHDHNVAKKLDRTLILAPFIVKSCALAHAPSTSKAAKEVQKFIQLPLPDTFKIQFARPNHSKTLKHTIDGVVYSDCRARLYSGANSCSSAAMRARLGALSVTTCTATHERTSRFEQRRPHLGGLL